LEKKREARRGAKRPVKGGTPRHLATGEKERGHLKEFQLVGGGGVRGKKYLQKRIGTLGKKKPTRVTLG